MESPSTPNDGTVLNRFVSLLLIPIFVLGSAVPHSHAGSSAPIPSDHSARPHIHVGSHHHGHHGHTHSHEHDEPSDPLVATAGPDDAAGSCADRPLGHDADAIYLLDTGDYTPPSTPMERESGEPLLTFLPHLSDSSPPALQRPAHGHSFLPHYGLPIFLLDAALRL